MQFHHLVKSEFETLINQSLIGLQIQDIVFRNNRVAFYVDRAISLSR